MYFEHFSNSLSVELLLALKRQIIFREPSERDCLREICGRKRSCLLQRKYTRQSIVIRQCLLPPLSERFAGS